jgi:F-box-like
MNINQLPKEIILEIFGHVALLGDKEWAQLRSVCQLWATLANNAYGKLVGGINSDPLEFIGMLTIIHLIVKQIGLIYNQLRH